jgi:sugar phosphate isomerase/epimerase
MGLTCRGAGTLDHERDEGGVETMRLCYALRRGVYYPSQRDTFGELPPKEHRPAYLKAVKRLGFDGLEIGGVAAGEHADEAVARELRHELEGSGLPVACVRSGGPIAHPRFGLEVLHRVRESLRYAHLLGASVVNVTCVTPATEPGGPGERRVGEPVSQGGSRLVSEADFELTARRFREIGELAGNLGLDVSIEVHQGSLADNSWSALHLCDLIGLPNVGPNPDLGNIFWHYDVAEETPEEAILAMASRAKYWHCKNLKKVHLPELRRAIYLRVPLPDGDIDYRFAISAMAAAGYQGYLAVEGMREGDQLSGDGRSAEYVRGILASLDTE